MLEDNVRAPVETCADLIWEAMEASRMLRETEGVDCNFRFAGWLSSMTNLEYLYDIHSRKRGFPRTEDTGTETAENKSIVFPLPLLEHVDIDIPIDADAKFSNSEESEPETTLVGEEKSNSRQHSRPGGNFM